MSSDVIEFCQQDNGKAYLCETNTGVGFMDESGDGHGRFSTCMGQCLHEESGSGSRIGTGKGMGFSNGFGNIICCGYGNGNGFRTVSWGTNE